MDFLPNEWCDYTYEDYLNFQFRRFTSLRDGEHGVYLGQTIPACANKKWVPYYHFIITQGGYAIGHVNFRVSNIRQILDYDGHIGYYVHPNFRGQRAALIATRLVLPFIAEHGFEEITLTCRPNNIASSRTIEALGAEYQHTATFPEFEKPWDKEKKVYTLDLKQR